nr:O-antigen ligase family protein [uncultured Blautia sp.]
MVIKKRKLGYICILLYVFLVLSLPDGIKNMTALYKMSTRGINITYTYNYYFSFLELPIIIYGIAKYKRSNSIRFFKVFVALVILNLAYWFLNLENVIQLNSYEMFLLLLTGFSAAVIVMNGKNTLQDIDNIIDWFTILQFILLIVSMISGASGSDGRYAAIGMGSGATANIASYYLVWTFFAKEGKTKMIPVLAAFITIILTGSRTNLLAFLLIAIVFIGRLIRKQIMDGNKRKMLYAAVGIVLIVTVILLMGHGIKMESLSRVTNLLQGNVLTNVTTDGSYLGRLRSVEGSLKILDRYPNGLPFSIYSIERESARMFSMEYPHSTLISYILLWSPPIAWGCLIYLIFLFVKAIRQKDNSAIFLGFNIAMLILYGSPILYAKTYAFLFILISYAKTKLSFEREGHG